MVHDPSEYDPPEHDPSNLPTVSGSVSAQVCAVMLVLYALYFARSLAVPIVTAIVLYLILRPIVRQARRLGIPPSIGAAAVIITLLVIFSLATYLVFQPARVAIAEAPRHLAVIKDKLAFITDRVQQINEATETIAETADGDGADEDDYIAESPIEDEAPVPVEIKQPVWASNMSYLSGTGNVVTFLTISGALLYFLLATGDQLLRNIMRALPNFMARRRLVEVIENVQEGLGSYLAQVAIINAGLGLAVGISMWLLGMPSPVLFGVMAFAFNFVPIVGAIAGAAIIFLVALVHFEPTYYSFLVTGIFLSLTSLEGQFITPSVLGRSMRMSPVLVFLSITIWGWMWGMIGIFLSVPILIAARMACESHESLTPLAMVLGADVTRHDPRHDQVPRGPASQNDSRQQETAAQVEAGRLNRSADDSDALSSPDIASAD